MQKMQKKKSTIFSMFKISRPFRWFSCEGRVSVGLFLFNGFLLLNVPPVCIARMHELTGRAVNV